VVGVVGAEGPRLTVVIPAFNEARRFGDRAAKLTAAAAEGFLPPHETELIVVDDGSTDGTGFRAERLLAPAFPFFRMVRLEQNAGKGAAIRQGVAAARAPVTLFMDADMSVDPSQISRLVDSIGPNDVAMGSRALPGSVVESDRFHRKMMGRTFNALVRGVTGMPFRDTQCGFKAFRTSLARILFHLMAIDRFAFDVELLSLALQLDMGIAEVPVHWRYGGESSVRALGDSVSMTLDLVRVRNPKERSPIPGLEVSSMPGGHRQSQVRVLQSVREVLGAVFPVAIDSDARIVALLPLCDAVEVADVTSRLLRLSTNLSVRERSVSLPELTALVPFRWIDNGGDGMLVASHGEPPLEAATRPAPENWESPARTGLNN
jgi:dolichyl-phosphate beta-glucosyltransferase